HRCRSPRVLQRAARGLQAAEADSHHRQDPADGDRQDPARCRGEGLHIDTQGDCALKIGGGLPGDEVFYRSPGGGPTSSIGGNMTTRWRQLLFGIICMVMIANLQYGWTLFVGPIDQKYHWGRAAIQLAFTIFVLTETWLVPIEGYLIDRFGPRIMIGGSGVLVAIAWVMNSMADSLLLLYLGAAIGG